jgi:CRP/FNR family transcriptional regulator, cyclic AMP receptor protein
MSLDVTAFENILSALPVTTYQAGDSILSDGSKTGRLLILKSGEVAVLKNSAVLARVDQPGAVFGELAALLDQPHVADVRALQDSQFHVADAELLEADSRHTDCMGQGCEPDEGGARRILENLRR